MTQAKLTQAEIHRDAAEQLLASKYDGYPALATEALLKALVHATLALGYAKAE